MAQKHWLFGSNDSNQCSLTKTGKDAVAVPLAIDKEIIIKRAKRRYDALKGAAFLKQVAKYVAPQSVPMIERQKTLVQALVRNMLLMLDVRTGTF